MTFSRLVASFNSTVKARLDGAGPLHFARHHRESDLPAHVQAGSAVRRWGQRLIVLQDDVHALAVLDERSGDVTPLLLPPGEDGRRTFGEALGNKALKLDLEASVVLPDGRLVAFGSGSSAQRETIIIVDEAHMVRIVEGNTFYANLRDRQEFAGSELNLEGAVVSGGTLKLFQRGNGAVRAGVEPVNAIGDIDLAAFVAWLDGGAVPGLTGVWQVDLGKFNGVPFGFTDATALDDGRIAFIAVAEDSPDTYQDGHVGACRFGWLDKQSVTLVDIAFGDGPSNPLKLEGIDWVGVNDAGDWEFVVVADMDDPDVPAVMGTLSVAPF